MRQHSRYLAALISAALQFRAGSVQFVTADSRITVPSCRTGTSSEIRNDNLQVTVVRHMQNYTRIYYKITMKNLVITFIFLSFLILSCHQQSSKQLIPEILGEYTLIYKPQPDVFSLNDTKFYKKVRHIQNGNPMIIPLLKVQTIVGIVLVLQNQIIIQPMGYMKVKVYVFTQ